MLDLSKGSFPIIIKPNLGQPILLNLGDFKNKANEYNRSIIFDSLIITKPSHHKHLNSSFQCI